ncbi:MAG: ClpP family protease [Elusimicrobiota bacterium]
MADKNHNGNGKKDNRIIFLKGDINEQTVHDVISKLIDYEASDPFSDILIYIDSYGGYYDSFIAIHDAMKMCRCDIATVCVGKAMSAGQMILTSGTKGKRFITPNSRVLMHPINSAAFGNIHELDNNITETRRLQAVWEKMAVKYTNMTKKQVEEKMKKDSYMSAEEALNLGIVDIIIKKPTDLYKNIKVNRNV